MASVGFRVLGPIEIAEDGVELRVPSGKALGLLAFLLLHANQSVSVDEVVDALWADDAPPTARHAVEVHVSRLRSALGPYHTRLQTRGGYSLRLEADELDLLRFERLTADARAARRRGDPANAEELLLAAERLWTGLPLANVANEPFAPPAIARLQEERQAALEDRIEAGLFLGHHAQLVGELEAVVAREPFRERLWGQLMLALYRSGRQADALRAYRSARSRFVGELGLDPGPELQELQHLILRQDPSLAPVPSPVPSTIAQAPPSATPFLLVPERKLVTVLFARLTALPGGPNADPEHDAARLETAMAVFRAMLASMGASVERLPAGDLMAIFGTPATVEDHADRAIDASGEMRRRCLDDRDLCGGGLAVGIATGEVIVTDRAAATGPASGPVVELAARLEQLAGPGEILVAERTVAAARVRHRFSDRIDIHLTAPGDRFQARRLVDPAPDDHATAPRPNATSDGLIRAGQVFVGRQSELSTLRAAFDRALSDDAPVFVTVIGEAGIGKSSLIRRFAADALSAPGVRVLNGRCLAYGRGITYWPLGEVLRQHLGIRGDEPPDSLLRALGGRAILGLTFGLDPGPGVHPLAAMNQLHGAWIDLLDEALVQGPMILVIEDLHWAEDPLLELLRKIQREVTGKLLIVGTARPDFASSRPDWTSSRRRNISIWLDPLSAAEGRALASQIVGDRAPSAVEAAIERADGNPFFLEELLASILEGDRRKRIARQPAVSPPAGDMAIPDKVRAIIGFRLDTLAPVEKAGLQAASVAGRLFASDAVREIMGSDAEPDFRQLVDRDFLRAVARQPGGSSPEYAFRHALTRDVAYRSLPIARRARLHAAYADRLLRVGRGRDEDAPLLAYHYAEAARPEELALAWGSDSAESVRLGGLARTWLKRAAHLALARYSIDETIALLERSLDLAPPIVEQTETWVAIGRANVLRYDGVGFWSAMQHAIDAAPSDEIRASIYAELAFETAFRWAIWKRMPARELVDGWIDRAIELSEPGTAPRVRALVARTYWHPRDAMMAANEAVRIAAGLKSPELSSYALDARALVAFVAGRYREAQRWWRRRARLAGAISDLDHLEDLYGSVISGYAALGRFSEARHYAKLHDDVAMQLSSHQRVHAVAMHLELEELAGNWPAIAALRQRTEDAVAANAATPCVRNQRSLLVCALAAAELGDGKGSRRLAKRADELAMEGYESVFNPVRVRLAMLAGEMPEVRRLVPVEMPPPTKNWWRLTTIAARLDALIELGELDHAAREAGGFMEAGTFLEPFARRTIGFASGDRAEIEWAVKRFEALGLDWHAARTRALLDGPPSKGIFRAGRTLPLVGERASFAAAPVVSAHTGPATTVTRAKHGREDGALGQV